LATVVGVMVVAVAVWVGIIAFFLGGRHGWRQGFKVATDIWKPQRDDAFKDALGYARQVDDLEARLAVAEKADSNPTKHFHDGFQCGEASASRQMVFRLRTVLEEFDPDIEPEVDD
jgi:hypothetical protein